MLRYARKNTTKRSPPKLPSFGVIDDSHAYLAEVDDAAIIFVRGNIVMEERQADDEDCEEEKEVEAEVGENSSDALFGE